MQQRFCSCGAGVWVRYFFANAFWLAFFYRGDGGDISTTVCPKCGRALDIEHLR
ncbi:conserved hypothetical protein [uncultured delta proteobacterium]|uniref:Uncharacterized protein n=1 Tax=uncultured delta proteobacterium TaxID=34034 RepID=A0A212J467_9DELT|nr:conserved hypothetical protein [uncultured delta proteobacterium]